VSLSFYLFRPLPSRVIHKVTFSEFHAAHTDDTRFQDFLHGASAHRRLLDRDIPKKARRPAIVVTSRIRFGALEPIAAMEESHRLPHRRSHLLRSKRVRVDPAMLSSGTCLVYSYLSVSDICLAQLEEERWPP
jgi:hypothetical protein